jgi:uncharacterized protein (DUF305 family)
MADRFGGRLSETTEISEMAETTAVETSESELQEFLEIEQEDERSSRALMIVAGAAIALAVIMAIVAGWALFGGGDDPGDDSVDAGFARDMSTHHSQAVEMSSIVFLRTEDDAIRSLAYDILTTQQAQIGMMGGWLALWDLPAGSDQPTMAWMGHEGAMPGMATDEEIDGLRTLPPADMDREFLRLMIDHHKGAIDMANYAAQNAEEDLVRTVARSMAETQSFEITNMEQMLTERGG